MKNENKNKNKDNQQCPTPSADAFHAQPKNVYEQINKYGTYEIQPTSDSGNEYPAIAQGMSRKKEKKLEKEREKWIKTGSEKYTK
ncbi:MAG: hypothetical protein GX107_00165 [Clostridiales bacterium]|jgi:hypothetical protein|nr:hypothetical protein [Clostridiales bacterium]